MKNISRSLGSVKSLFLTFLVITSTNLLSQENEEQILNINLGLYVCENELSKEVPEEEIYGFDCSYRKDMNNEIEIVSVVLNRNIFIDDHKEACIRRISTVEEIYNAIEELILLGQDYCYVKRSDQIIGIVCLEELLKKCHAGIKPEETIVKFMCPA